MYLFAAPITVVGQCDLQWAITVGVQIGRSIENAGPL